MKNHPPVKTAIVLLNMGGPDKLEDVEPFLFNLFSDREIIRLGPRFMQKFLARIISRRRAPKSRKIYANIGGGSPLRKITLQQAAALEKVLAKTKDYSVVVAMRYWQPRSSEVIKQLHHQGIQRIIALSLYPHYSRATTGSSLNDLQCAIDSFHHPVELITISSWPDHPLYVQSLTKNILRKKAAFGDVPLEIVYSAHSLPQSFIDEGDPYLDHLKKTITLIEKQTHHRGILCFQSRSGPVKWLSPSTPDTLVELAKNGCKNILMVPLSFVSDHVETLYEIDILYRKQAENLGIRLESIDSLNTNPTFINCLQELVLGADNCP